MTSEDIGDAEKELGYKLHGWKIKVTDTLLALDDAIAAAGCGRGKTTPFLLLAIVRRIRGLKGMTIVVTVTKKLGSQQARE